MGQLGFGGEGVCNLLGRGRGDGFDGDCEAWLTDVWLPRLGTSRLPLATMSSSRLRPAPRSPSTQ